MKTYIIILIIGALIQSFLHSTKGTIHAFEKIFGSLYSLLFVILTILSIIKFGWSSLIIIPLIFFASNLIFSILFDKLFK